jgi:hypothetical protein
MSRKEYVKSWLLRLGVYGKLNEIAHREEQDHAVQYARHCLGKYLP